MNSVTGWNMHSVVEVAPQTEADTKIAAAIDVLSVHVPEWLDHPTTNFSMLNTITASPRAELAHLRALADTLGFLIIPFGYLDPRSYAEESHEIQYAIRGFNDILSSKFLIYALCPLEHYSLERHIANAENTPFHVPKEYAQAFMALDMCLPIFRSMQSDISKMREDISVLSKKLELNIRAQQEREERARMHMRDPMLIAVPKGESLQGNGRAIIGPAWGPDIEEILLRSYKLTVKPMQRKMIEASVLKLFGNGNQMPKMAAPQPKHYRVHVSYAPLPDWSELKKEFGIVSEIFDGSRPWKMADHLENQAPGERFMFLKEFANPMKSRAVISWGARNGYRPATHQELIDFARAYPDLQHKSQLVALGSHINKSETTGGRYGFPTQLRWRYVAVMSQRAGERGLQSGEYSRSWSKCRFLFVRQ